MKTIVYDYQDYQKYLNVRFDAAENRGLRARLAEMTHTSRAFISKMLNGSIDLAPEHIPPVNELLNHNKDESHYFTLLVLESRAGTAALKQYFTGQLEELRDKRKQFLGRVKITERASELDEARYNSKWYYTAMHLLSGVPQFQTADAISKRLELPLPLTTTALEELREMGFMEKKGNRYVASRKRIHLSKNSPWISQLHSHFRFRAIQNLTNREETDLHFSLGMAVSKSFIENYRKKILELVVEQEEEIVKAKEEDLYAINIDLFKF